MEEDLKELDEYEKNGWDWLMRIVGGLRRVEGERRSIDWWNDELEMMANDVKRLSSGSSNDWRLVRKVFRNSLLQMMFNRMKEMLAATTREDVWGIVR